MNLYCDSEFSRLSRDGTFISLGIVAETGETFYAEFNDYNRSHIGEWHDKHVLAHLVLVDGELNQKISSYRIRGSSFKITQHLTLWLNALKYKWAVKQFHTWWDCPAYDWVFFVDLMANKVEGYPQLPSYLFYLPFDILPLFDFVGIDPDISREEFLMANDVELPQGIKHNALYDARVIKLCHEVLLKKRQL